MRTGAIRILTFAVVLLLAGAVTAGDAVWISDTGERHKVGAHAIFLDEDGDFFDLSELEDGETKIFGSGDKQITASRSGDTIAIDRPEGGDESAISIECEVGRDTCKVMTFGENDQKVALMIKKRHPGHHVMTIDTDVMVGEAGEATIVIKQIGDCGDGEEDDCIAQEIEMFGGSVHTGEMVVEVVGSPAEGDLHKNIWISSGGSHHGHHAMMVTDGATQHDLSELYDGETRIFGFGDRQVSAVREGDEVRISRPQSDDGDDVLVTCTIGRDTCQVLTYDDDPERVAIVIAKTAGCGGDGDDCEDFLRLHMEEGHEGEFEVIELRDGGSGNIYIAHPDENTQTIRRIKIVREEDD